MNVAVAIKSPKNPSNAKNVSGCFNSTAGGNLWIGENGYRGAKPSLTRLYLDFESASVLDVREVGIHNYSTHPSTRPLMLAYAVDDDEPRLWFPHADQGCAGSIFENLRKLLLNPTITKVAWNAPFERAIFHRCLGIWIPYEQWADVMIWSRHLSLPGSLEKAGPAIGLPPNLLKIQDGKRLINKFSSPYHKGGEETLFGISEPQFHNWEDEPRDWELFGEYCKQDVIAERAILKLVENIPLPESEQRAWILDQKINDRGIPANRKFLQNALALSLEAKKRLTAKLKELTGLANPNSRNQFLKWALEQKYPHTSLGKNLVKSALAPDSGITPELRTALKLRQEASKTSYTKFETMLAFLSSDDRLRDQFAFMGGSRTGRWAGKDAQVQNQTRPAKEIETHYDEALALIEAGDYDKAAETVVQWYDPKPDFPPILALTTSCVRSAFQASAGKKLVVCDLGAIENRKLGWLAKCDAILKVFRDGRDPYLDFGSKMYHVAYELINKIQRQIAKPAVLGAGYGLGPGATRHCSVCDKEVSQWDKTCAEHPRAEFKYKAKTETDDYGNTVLGGLMGYAANMGVKLTPEQAYLAWETFRKSYPEVVDLWNRYQKAAVKVLKTGQAVRVGEVVFQRRKRKDGTFILRIQLPSGRGLHYINARVETEVAHRRSDGEPYDRDKLLYDGIGHGVGQMVKGWGQVYTYGGKLTENIDQASSRDVLVNGMFLADEMGMNIVAHVHDEIICEEDDDPFAPSIQDLKWCMEQTPKWAPGLLLAAEGWEGHYYKK